MSKPNSRLFSRTHGQMISQGLSPAYQKEILLCWALETVNTLSKISKRKRDNFKTACVAFDEVSGSMFFGRNGGITKYASNVSLNPVLFGIDGIGGILPKESHNNYPTPWNCAETDAINQALNSGSKLENLHIYTIDTTKNNFGKDKISCENCTTAYKNRIKSNNTGWFSKED